MHRARIYNNKLNQVQGEKNIPYANGLKKCINEGDDIATVFNQALDEDHSFNLPHKIFRAQARMHNGNCYEDCMSDD